MSDNVIVFPKSHRTTPPKTIEELYQSIEEVRKEHIEHVLDNVLEHSFQYVMAEGFDVTKDECAKSMGLVIESLRSLLFQTEGYHHELQGVAESIFTHDDEEDDDSEEGGDASESEGEEGPQS